LARKKRHIAYAIRCAAVAASIAFTLGAMVPKICVNYRINNHRRIVMALPKYFEAIENHLDKYFNENDEIMVIDEIESPDFHLDIYWIKPNKNRNYTLLLSNGISSMPFETPDKSLSKYIELCILLPPDWDMENDNWKKSNNYWPIGLIKSLGRYPSENNTWLGYGHTIPRTEPMTGTNFMATILLKSITLSDDFQKIKYGKKTIEVYLLFPLFSEELEYKKINGTDKLLELLEKEKLGIHMTQV
jgi:hypothetical protein